MRSRPLRDKSIEELSGYIGKSVRKLSDKPFKCGLLTVTVKGVETSPYTGEFAFRIEEDDTIVTASECVPAPEVG